MLFQSHVFLFLFLPVTLGGFLLLSRKNKSATPPLLWLMGASLIFYGYWSVGYALLLLACVCINYALVWQLCRMDLSNRFRTPFFYLSVAANLVFLCFFKYGNFWFDLVNAWAGTHFARLVFPIGISFYTFVQIGCLIDAYNQQIGRLELVKYLTMGVFFPYIGAGPIVQRREMMTQLDDVGTTQVTTVQVAAGMSIFLMGLFKKLVIADNIEPYVDTFFQAAETGHGLAVTTTWIGVCTYALQVYFDFSGYSDMAVGLGQMFGVRLPQNFNSPLKATSVIEFWRCWHITMTRFFTNNIYAPMAAAWMRKSLRNRYPAVRRFLLVVAWPMIITFTLAGVWHGVGWGWVLYGVFHGVALTINHGWRELRLARKVPEIPAFVGWVLMIVVFSISTVLVRSDSVPTALKILAVMAGFGAEGAPGPGDFFGRAVVCGFQVIPVLLWIIPLLAMVRLLPNSNEVFERYEVALDTAPRRPVRWFQRVTWQPSVRWAVALALTTMISLAFIHNQSPFIYYRF